MRTGLLATLLLGITSACGDDGGTADTDSNGGETSNGSESTTDDATTGSTSAGGECPSDPIEPGMLQWEALPNLADSPDDHAGMSMVFDYYREDHVDEAALAGDNARERLTLLAQGRQAALWVSPEHRVALLPDYLHRAIQQFVNAEPKLLGPSRLD